MGLDGLGAEEQVGGDLRVRTPGDDEPRHLHFRRFGGQDLPHLYAWPNHPDAAFDEVDAVCAEQDLARLVAEWESARRAVEDLPLDRHTGT